MLHKFILTISILFYFGCSGAKELDSQIKLLKDSGGLSQFELNKAGEKIGKDIIVHFKKNPNPNGVALAILLTKNDTSEQLSTDVFEEALVRILLLGKITTLRTDKRAEQLKEIKLGLQLGTGLSSANLKSPNYFIKTVISEEMFSSSGDKIVEQILNTELINVESLSVDFSNKETFRKQAVQGKGIGW
jgi:hypothetical protein